MPWARGGGFVTVDGESDREFDETFAEDAALVSSLTSPLLAGGGETKRSEPVGELSRRGRRLGASGPPAPQAVTPSSALSWTVGPGSRGTERGKQIGRAHV